MTTMMGRLVLAALVLMPLLGGCGAPVNNFSPTVGPAGGANGPSDPSQRLAITYRFTLRVPNAEADALQQKHLAECKKLGCEVLNTSVDRANEGRITGRATIRIKPGSFDAFATILAAPPAEITARSRSAEDLNAPIRDVERRLEMKTVLRDRLTAMLRDQTAKTAADLITIEKELAQIQSDIEAATAQRDGLLTRTDTVRVEISYQGVASLWGGVDLSPIYQAVRAINQTVVYSISWLISTLAALVPWLPVIALIWWLSRRGIRSFRSRKP
ncbi:hypothetical protein PMI42_07135 [Bradyrhizobium sp. YR681]|uniref:DUF4349 domain-containing protein n=1 Tax=Bradyrhizobium sp. YR681 TaxID=1144344 RepID=UPI00026F48B8|nr:DUF4349 domain-containing protein [Bradyrhizobium sp. YR681]EJN08661.1 hypothetical protein PMI42_07135 [Bradyrhizobium sp. YR681]